MIVSKSEAQKKKLRNRAIDFIMKCSLEKLIAIADLVGIKVQKDLRKKWYVASNLLLEDVLLKINAYALSPSDCWRLVLYLILYYKI